jgi:signal transduction histidine kinase
MNLDLARRSPHRAELWEQCDRVLDHCISEVRTLSYLLHPPMIEDVGFLSAAEWYIQDFNRRSGMRIVFEVAENVGSPPNSTQLVLFRILQEALINIHRHARATAGSVRVSKHNGNLLLEISDNGVGVPAERLHRFNGNGSGMGVGLTGTWERVRDLGGQVELIARNPGTAVRISIPFSKPAKPNGRPN